MPIPENNNLLILDYETTGVPVQDHFPIEVGIIAVNSSLEKLWEYERLIRWDDLVEFDIHGVDQWKPEYKRAGEIHKIPAAAWRNNCERPERVAHELTRLMAETDKGWATSNGLPKKWILCSDNIQFEYRFTLQLWEAAEKYQWPFHYCGWDTSFLLEMTGVGDPQGVPHRALADARGLYEAILKAKKIVGKAL